MNLKNIYTFIITLTIVAFISGYIFSNLNNTENIDINYIKENRIDIKNKLVEPLIILPLSITIIPNIIRIFYKPFTIGYLFQVLISNNVKNNFLYIFIYYILPLFLELILISISYRIIYNFIKKLFNKHNKLSILIKKYLFVSITYLIYITLIYIFNLNINSILL